MIVTKQLVVKPKEKRTKEGHSKVNVKEIT
jgi:hypothetical protein